MELFRNSGTPVFFLTILTDFIAKRTMDHKYTLTYQKYKKKKLKNATSVYA
jgi:hypothetical protein